MSAEIIEAAKEVLPENSARRWFYEMRLGESLVHLGEFNRAELILLEVEERLPKLTGEPHLWITELRDVLVDLYDAWERPDDAERWRDRLAEE